jgi:hypothetical protein
MVKVYEKLQPGGRQNSKDIGGAVEKQQVDSPEPDCFIYDPFLHLEREYSCPDRNQNHQQQQNLKLQIARFNPP